MSMRAKKAWVSVIGLIGLLVLLLGAAANLYPTIAGVIAAIVIWIASGILAKYWGLKEEKAKKEKA